MKSQPMNGRALTAQDIEYNFHRYLGLGSGFTERAEFVGWLPGTLKRFPSRIDNGHRTDGCF